jgi:hypothetical protein
MHLDRISRALARAPALGFDAMASSVNATSLNVPRRNAYPFGLSRLQSSGNVSTF